MIGRLLFAGAIVLASLGAAAEQAGKQLSIARPALRQYEDGPLLPAGASFMTGDTIFFTFQIQGFKVAEDSNIDLHYRIEAVDPQGVRVAEPIEHDVQTQISAEDKNWMPLVRESFQVPPLALPGTYHVRLMVADKLAGQKTESELNVVVRGRKVEPSPTLAARDFRFLRSEEDRDPLTSAVYHPGETIWGRFEIVGFKYGEKNHIHVEYGIAVLAPSGKTLYSQPTAAVEDDATYYPKRYLPGALSLTLGKDFRPGQYTVGLTLRDEVGKQTQEERYPFQVE